MTIMDDDTSRPSASGGAQTLLTGLQALTRRLQDERDALQQALDDATRALQCEKSARATLENALQVRELELLHVTQSQQHASQQLRDRIAQLEREVDDERALHQAAVASRAATLQKSAALADEVKRVEVKWRSEMEKKELALAEVEILRDDALTVTLDRDQLVARTEADAKRVRELWQQIAREHESKLDALRQELETTTRASASVERAAAQSERRAQELETSVAQLTEQNRSLEQRLAAADSDCDALRAQLETERVRLKAHEDATHALRLEMQALSSAAALAKEREATARREQKLAAAVLTKAQRELDDTTETLRALETEWGDLLDHVAQQNATRTLAAREQQVQGELRSQRLRRTKRWAEELAALQHKQLVRYQHVLATVNRKLDDVRETHEALEANAWTLHGDKTVQSKSLCIYRH